MNVRIVRIAGRFLVLAYLMVCVVSGLGCEKNAQKPSLNDKPNVLLVTFDTTRADYLSCYGRAGNTTPTIDALAREGVRFARCYAPAPITLPSHASIMTGLYPFQHKLRDNGGGVLDDKAVTLAELFRAAGYRTGAFVGAYVLHSRYGLHQGFDIYSDDFQGRGARMESGHEFAERRAAEVSEAALRWLDQKDVRPVFMWVHYFDPHSPYQAPGRGGGDTPENYAAEISYADGQLARVVSKVEELSSSSRRQAWYVVTADHGESLGEHGEATHGLFVYEATLRVPLVIKGPGLERGVVDGPVSLVDIYGSLIHWLGLATPYTVAGKPLPAKGRSADRPMYFETIVPFHSYGWSPLEGVIVGREKFIRAPANELYDLEADPGESHNLANQKADRIAEFNAALAAMQNPNSGVPSLSAGESSKDQTSLRMLETLGYVSGSGEMPSNAVSLPDAKAMIGIVEKIKSAEKALSIADPNGGELLFQILAADPNNLRALRMLEAFLQQPATSKFLMDGARARLQKPLPPPFDMEIPATVSWMLCRDGEVESGMKILEAAEKLEPESVKVLTAKSTCLERAGQVDEAVAMWEGLLKTDPQNAAAHQALGELYLRRNDFSRAVEHHSKAASLDEKNPQAQVNLANALLSINKPIEASAALRRALQLAPSQMALRSRLGSLLLMQGNAAEAVEQFKLVVAASPESPWAHFDHGVALSQADDPAAAVNAFRETLRLAPDHGEAMVNLGVTLLKLGREAEGRDALRRATTLDAVAGAAHYNLALAAWRTGDADEALARLEKAARSVPPSVPAIEDLATKYFREDKYAQARQVLGDALSVIPQESPAYLRILNSLATLLATCPDDAVRDGTEALRLARLADEKTNHAQPAILSTLASAQAETGDFDAAVETVNRALTLLGNQTGPLKAVLTRQLEDFRAGQPYRSKPRGSGEGH